jgi:hypothetical protein
VKRVGPVRFSTQLSTVFVNKPVEKWAGSSFIELIFLYFWLFAQIFSDKEMPAVSKRGVERNQKVGTLSSRREGA